MDDYSFHSTMALSLCLGWIADDPKFDVARAKKLLRRYREVRHLLVGSWYPLMPYSRDLTKWIASQYHRADLEEGIILAFRRPESQYDSVQVSMHGLGPDATYELTFDSTGRKMRLTGKALMKSISIRIPQSGRSDLIHYKRIGARR
jgi:alpha-galactosidase